MHNTLSEIATRDIVKITRFLEIRWPDYVDQFEDDLLNHVEKIWDSPQEHPYIYKPVRKYLRFYPYVVLYEVNENKGIHVHRVIHYRQDRD